MLADPITINNGTSNVVFNRTSQSGKASQYARTSNTAGDVMMMKVSHSVRNASSNNTKLKADQHYVQFTWQQINADTVSLETASVGLSIVLPQSGTFTRAEIDYLLIQVGNFIAGATEVPSTGATTITKLLLGES